MSSLQKSTNLAKKIINVTKAMNYLYDAHVDGIGVETVENEIAGIGALKALKLNWELEHALLLQSIKRHAIT